MCWKLVATITLVALWGTLGGCNTIRGVGKDIHDSAMNVQSWVEDSNTNVAQIPPPK